MLLNRRNITIVAFIVTFVFQHHFLLAKDFPNEELLKVLVISRHGARLPLQNKSILGEWAEIFSLLVY